MPYLPHVQDYPKLKVRTVNELGIRYDITPIEDVRVVQLYWLMPPPKRDYKKKNGLLGLFWLERAKVASIPAAQGLVTEITEGRRWKHHNWLS